MKYLFTLVFMFFIILTTCTADMSSIKYDNVSQDFKKVDLYESNLTFYKAADTIKWELLVILGSGVFLGAKSLNWGNNKSFNFNNEGWFGLNTGSAGADKLGHMYSSYLINEFFNKSLLSKTGNVRQSALYSAVFSSSFMLMVEVLDGYSDDHGFSYEDLIFNSIGIGVSYLKNTVPGLDNKLDLRIQYSPTEAYRDHPILDYSGHTYSAALKLGGFKELEDTPLKYFELQVGYHAEGFKRNEELYFPKKRTELYFAIGIDLTELIFKPLKKHTQNPLVDYVDTFFRYYQAPVYLSTPIHERKQAY